MENALELKNGHQSRKSGQNVAKTSGGAATTHGNAAKLRRRIQRNTETYYGKGSVSQYVVRLQRRGRREWFELGSELDVAIRRAREIDHYLQLHGWESTRQRFKPGFEAEKSDVTVGRYLELVAQQGQLYPHTFYEYAASFRQIAGTIRGLKFTGSDKYSGRATPSKWRQLVDVIPLNILTPAKVMEWRDGYVGGHAVGSAARTKREHSANSCLRNGRALFAKRLLKRLRLKCPNLVLPSPMPFEGVELFPERESDFFYTSEVDVKKLIEAAFKELSGNQLVIFILALGAGLRRNEIDKLLMAHLDLKTGVVTIAPTAYNRLKSDSSVGKIQLEPRFVEKLREVLTAHEGEFVLTSENAPRMTGLQHYRCKKDFAALNAWLKSKGMTRATNRVHTLRKEFGSHLAQRRGIFAASAGLRHSTIGITRKFYVASEIEPTAFCAPDTDGVSGTSDAMQLLEQLKKALEQSKSKPAA